MENSIVTVVNKAPCPLSPIRQTLQNNNKPNREDNKKQI